MLSSPSRRESPLTASTMPIFQLPQANTCTIGFITCCTPWSGYGIPLSSGLPCYLMRFVADAVLGCSTKSESNPIQSDPIILSRQQSSSRDSAALSGPRTPGAENSGSGSERPSSQGVQISVNTWTVAFSELSIQRMLGEGAFGKVGKTRAHTHTHARAGTHARTHAE